MFHKQTNKQAKRYKRKNNQQQQQKVTNEKKNNSTKLPVVNTSTAKRK